MSRYMVKRIETSSGFEAITFFDELEDAKAYAHEQADILDVGYVFVIKDMDDNGSVMNVVYRRVPKALDEILANEQKEANQLAKYHSLLKVAAQAQRYMQ